MAKTYLLGQLVRADDSNKGRGVYLLKNAIEIIKQANILVGCRVIILDCSDNLLHYYEQHGFRFLYVTDPIEDKQPINQIIQIIQSRYPLLLG